MGHKTRYFYRDLFHSHFFDSTLWGECAGGITERLRGGLLAGFAEKYYKS